MQKSEEGAEMGAEKVGLACRLAIILFLLCLINLFFIEPGQAEFYIIIISMSVNALFILGSIIYLNKKKP